MKLIVQSDDYGITKGVSQGIIESIKNGIVRNTGLFSNMPWTEECVDYIKPYLHEIALGLDLNMSTGSPLCDPAVIPGLVQENGEFKTSAENRALDKQGTYDHCAEIADQVEKEFESQIQRYIELLGKTPDYLHGHAYGSLTTLNISRKLAQKYQIRYSMDLVNEVADMKQSGMGWYKYPTTFENQLSGEPIKYITGDRDKLLDHAYGYLILHCGYCDAELFELSSFNLNRVKDLQACTSKEVMQWIKDNNVQLINYNDLKGL